MKRGNQQLSDHGIEARQAGDAVDRRRDVLPRRQRAGQQQKRWEQHRKDAEQICGACNNRGVQNGSRSFAETRGKQQTGPLAALAAPPVRRACARSSIGPSVILTNARAHGEDAVLRSGATRLVCRRTSQSPNYCCEQPTRVFMRVTDLAALRPRTDGRGSGWFRNIWLRLAEEASRPTFFEHGGVRGWTVTMQARGGTPSRTVV